MAELTGSEAATGENIYRSDMIVKEVLGTDLLYAELQTDDGNARTHPSGGFEYVRLGNSGSYPNRQGSLYLTADDLYAPYKIAKYLLMRTCLS